MQGSRCHRQLESVAEEHRKTMDETKPAPPRNSSRTLVIALVAVLIVVAIAGIVLAGLRGRSAGSDPAAPSSSTQQAGSRRRQSPQPRDRRGGRCRAEPGRLRERLRSAVGNVAQEDRRRRGRCRQEGQPHGLHRGQSSKRAATAPQRMELAKKRADAVRRALQVGGDADQHPARADLRAADGLVPEARCRSGRTEHEVIAAPCGHGRLIPDPRRQAIP